MPIRTQILTSFYQDSVVLMRAASEVRLLPGVREAAAFMGTPANHALLEQIGLSSDASRRARPDDLILVVDAVTDAAAEAALTAARERLAAQRQEAAQAAAVRPRTLDSALRLLPRANLVAISVPGAYAKFEAMRALKRGLHVFLFSDHVSIEDEVDLKEEALRRRRLCMGPDCGTAYLNGTGLGFSNLVPRGRIGLVAASGTGLQAVACRLAAAYIRFVRRTGRWSIEGAAIPERLIAAGRPFIVAFWHGRLLMLPEAWRYSPRFNMVISRHPDGRLIARTVKYLGIDTIVGSSSRGGPAALRAMLRALANGECVGVTPDGPRGPRMRASAGVVHAARLSGAPIVPLVYSATPSRLLDSWDRLMVPLPMGRGVIQWGEPIEIASDADDAEVAAAVAAVESRLNAMTGALDARLGIKAVEPAPPAPGEPAEARA